MEISSVVFFEVTTSRYKIMILSGIQIRKKFNLTTKINVYMYTVFIMRVM